MYSNEIKDYINKRNGMLNRAETLYITDVNLHPQLNHITYNPWDFSYDMWDRFGNHYHFGVIEN